MERYGYFMKKNLSGIIAEIAAVLEQMGQGDYRVSLEQNYVGEFVENFSGDVQPAGGRTAAKQHGLTEAQHKDVADKIHKRLSGDGIQRGQQILQQGEKGGIQQRGDDGFGTEFLAHQQHAQRQQHGVQQQRNGGDAQRQKFA